MGACRKGTRLNHRNGSSASSSANAQDQADGSSLLDLPCMCAMYNDSVKLMMVGRGRMHEASIVALTVQ